MMRTTGHDTCRTRSEGVVAFVRRFFPAAMAAAILFFAARPASGTYFMYRAKPPKFLFQKESSLFARSPRLNRPFEYRKIYMPHTVSAAPSRAKSLPQFDLRVRPQTLYDIRLEEFIVECERLLREDRRELDNRSRDFLLFSPIFPVNPSDRRAASLSVTGMIAIAKGVSWAPSAYAVAAASHLAGAASTNLGRGVQSVGTTALEESGLAGISLLILSVGSSFDLSRNDFETIVNYMRAGGFLYLDRDRNGHAYQGFTSAVNRSGSTRSGQTVQIAPLPSNHPLSAVFAANGTSQASASNTASPLAIRCDGKICGIVADSSFMTRWSAVSEESGALRSGVELLSFVLNRATPDESAGKRDRR